MGKDAARSSKPIQLKVFIDNKKKKVMFAEAEEDFVEILFSFLTLPLGTIAKLSNKHGDSKDLKFGSLSSLYESIENLDNKHFSNEHCKIALVTPNSSSVSLCQKLKVNLMDDKKPVDGPVDEPIFVQKKASFIITDDLNVVPVLLDRSIALLNSLGVEYIDLLEERTISYFGFEEFSDLLKWSLVSNNPLTNLVLGASKPCSCLPCLKSSIWGNLPLVLGHSSESQTIKLLVQKSTKKVLCAQVENFFVEMLFSFLTIPLGTVKRLTADNASSMGIDKLYDSVSRLGNEKYLKYEETKTMLLSPKIAANYLRVSDLLPIYGKDTSSGSFLKEHGTFIVSDDLSVTVSPSLSTISKFNTLGVPVGDIEVMEVSIGEQEALLILKASLTSTSALTNCLSAFKKAKSLI